MNSNERKIKYIKLVYALMYDVFLNLVNLIPLEENINS